MLELRNDHYHAPMGKESAGVRWTGLIEAERDLLQLRRIQPWRNLVKPSAPKRFKTPLIKGWNIILDPVTDLIKLLPMPNLVVQTGVGRSGDRLFNISGGTTPTVLNALTQEVARIGTDNGTTAPTATSASSDAGGGTDTGSSSQTIRQFNSAATRASLVISASGTFNDATTGGTGAPGSGAAATWSGGMRRLFLTAHSANILNTTSADAANTLYSMTGVFTVDLTTLTTWAASFTAQTTLAGT